jgi:hypothetical protein
MTTTPAHAALLCVIRAQWNDERRRALFLRLVTNAQHPDRGAEALAVAEHFADQVDRANAAERTLMPLAYSEAVLVEGSSGVLVEHAAVYDAERARVEARAGNVTSVLRGDVLLTGAQ